MFEPVGNGGWRGNPPQARGGERPDGLDVAGVQLLSNDTVPEVFTYYEGELKANGWERYRRRDEGGRDYDVLVAEAYLRLTGAVNVSWEDRAHFFSIAARTMRRVLVDRHRRRIDVGLGAAMRAILP